MSDNTEMRGEGIRLVDAFAAEAENAKKMAPMAAVRLRQAVTEIERLSAEIARRQKVIDDIYELTIHAQNWAGFHRALLNIVNQIAHYCKRSPVGEGRAHCNHEAPFGECLKCGKSGDDLIPEPAEQGQ